MTSERRIIVSLADIKLISYECKKCGAKISFSPDAGLGAGESCFQCKHPWQSVYEDISTQAYSMQSPTRKLSQAIATMRNHDIAGPLGFRILLEFEEPSKSMPSVSQTSAPGQ